MRDARVVGQSAGAGDVAEAADLLGGVGCQDRGAGEAVADRGVAERTAAAKAAEAYARRAGAQLAVDRQAVPSAAPWSLAPGPSPPLTYSPTHLRDAPVVDRLAPPSSNGAAIAAAAPTGISVVAAFLRNVSCVGDWLNSRGYGMARRPVAVIAAGEQWPDGSLRLTVEDLLGAGAVISELCAECAAPLSAEAAAAKAGYEGTADVPHAIATSASGRHPAETGFVEDVVIAAHEDVCPFVPVRDGDSAFIPG
ncbi:2-phosphosulfolactate phosphatase [Streptomyces coerulescens]|uniref:Probable 2-phosphosulfolactate phosphatase n=1 Tax=Streptomyces coerulescens TaxID=29304 RepID=A0ABW0CXM6_STRCD